ncbi:MBL fold metallo-hydrolase [Nocardioides sp. NPDC000445]|uniref:MBL fold metallo-hydrolase n=1 Tax=Nocardioides sp. NPDC000445 TaxID=3154257 RepID=UPI00332A4ADA
MTARRWLHPQDYSGVASYRPPARWYRRLNPIGVPLTTWGLAPRDAVTLEVRGRRSGRPRRIPILVTRHEGADYLVALAGESQWVRNVRAAGGAAVLRRRGTRKVRLVELPVPERAPVLAAYLEAGRRRSGEAAAREQARWYFGLEGLPTPERLADLAPRYPVFRIADAAPGAGDLRVREIAPGVLCVGLGGRTQTNVYLVRTATGWLLVDAGWAGDADRIDAATKGALGPGRQPEAILLTHVHPDHSGAARELAGRWTCPVYLHPAELPIANGEFDVMRRTASPLDRWAVLPVMRAMGRHRREAVLARNALGEAARTLYPGAPVPGLPGWEVVATPGHTPGHVSLFRTADRVLISGDALVNLRLNSVRGLLLQQPGLTGPPWYSTWNPAAAGASIQHLAALHPRVLGPGHGHPLTGPDTPHRVDDVAGAPSAHAPRRTPDSEERLL